MRAINHALSGALIGLTIAEPAVALPLALVSHYVQDAIPHHDEDGGHIDSKLFNRLLVMDIILCLVLVIVLVLWRPKHWLDACFCAFLATALDFMWFKDFLRKRRSPRTNVFSKAHSWVQKITGPQFAVMEIGWAVVFIVLIMIIR